MKRHVKLFQAQFAEAVAEGRKLQTVRPMPAPNRMPAVGDAISLRRWTAAPYRSPQVILGEGKITRVAVVQIRYGWPVSGSIMVAGRWLDFAAAESFAKADGFPDLPNMLVWFNREHGPHFDGVLLQWELLSPEVAVDPGRSLEPDPDACAGVCEDCGASSLDLLPRGGALLCEVCRVERGWPQ